MFSKQQLDIAEKSQPVTLDSGLSIVLVTPWQSTGGTYDTFTIRLACESLTMRISGSRKCLVSITSGLKWKQIPPPCHSVSRGSQRQHNNQQHGTFYVKSFAIAFTYPHTHTHTKKMLALMLVLGKKSWLSTDKCRQAAFVCVSCFLTHPHLALTTRYIYPDLSTVVPM